MPNIFASMETGKNSLLTNQIGMDTTGHNIANLHTEGYSRQRANQGTMYPDDVQPGQIGRGVRVERVLRVYNQFIESTLRQEKTAASEWGVIYESNTLVELSLNEPGKFGLNNVTSEFFNSWQDLSEYPEDYGLRSLVRTAGDNFSSSYNQLVADFEDQRNLTDQKVQNAVTRINEILDDIAELNKRILSVEVAGKDPNDLKDRRDKLTSELSEYIDITIREEPTGLRITFGNYLLVEGNVTNKFATQQNALNDDMLDVTFGGGVINFNNISDNRKGKLGAYVKFRDNIITNYKQKLNEYAIYLAHNVNDEHFSGYSFNGTTTGLNFFSVTEKNIPPAYADQRTFSTRTGVIRIDTMTSIQTGSHHLTVSATMAANANGNITAGTGTIALNQTGTFTGSSGTDYYVNIVTQNAVAGDLAGMQVQLMRSGTAIGSVITVPAGAGPNNVVLGTVDGVTFDANITAGAATFNAGERSNGYTPNFTASLDGGASQAITPTALFTFTGGINNSFAAGGTMQVIFGGTLTVGNETITAYTDDVNMGIASNIQNNLNNIAAASAASMAGDNSNALDIVNIQFSNLMANNTQTFEQYYNEFTTAIGSDTKNAFRWKDNQDVLVDQLLEQRESISGVNLDEELIFMLKYQRGFESASRFITTIDGMIDVIINRMGYVGR